MVVRDQLAVCKFYASRLDFEVENGEEKSKNKSSKKREESGFDDDDDDDEESADSASVEVDGQGHFMTEQAFHNNLESSISLIEKTSKMHLNIYRELLRMIKPLERVDFNTSFIRG